MLVSEKKEWRVQCWDGRHWRQGLARTYEEACAELNRRHANDPRATLRIIVITRRVDAGDFVGPPPAVAAPSRGDRQ